MRCDIQQLVACLTTVLVTSLAIPSQARTILSEVGSATISLYGDETGARLRLTYSYRWWEENLEYSIVATCKVDEESCNTIGNSVTWFGFRSAGSSQEMPENK